VKDVACARNVEEVSKFNDINMLMDTLTGRKEETPDDSQIADSHLGTDTCGETSESTGDESILGLSSTRRHQGAANGSINCNDGKKARAGKGGFVIKENILYKTKLPRI